MTNLKVHFSSKTDRWSTPQDLFDRLNAEFNFQLDVCASADNKKCRDWFGIDKNVDGLTRDWTRVESIAQDGTEKVVGRRCWMNPPYGRTIGRWVSKAADEAKLGCTVVCLLPARTDTRWFHDNIYNKPNVEVRFLKGRLKFGGSKNSAPFPSMVVIFRP